MHLCFYDVVTSTFTYGGATHYHCTTSKGWLCTKATVLSQIIFFDISIIASFSVTRPGKESPTMSSRPTEGQQSRTLPFYF